MGFFDQFSSKKPATRSPVPAPAKTPDGPPPTAPTAAEAGTEKKASPGGVLPRLAEARAKLEAKDLAGAMAIYEEVLASAGNRPDVLVSLSGDLGAHGHTAELIDLVAPRYDAEKHGVAAGFNLLQAYIVVRNADAAQHLLDLLFSLQRPELEGRLVGFSNAVAELFVAETETESAAEAMPDAKINLVSISRPIWFYGLEGAAAQLLPKKEGKLRRVAFAQCALLNPELATTLATNAEDPLCRFARGFPLWLAETFYYSARYEPVAAVGTTAQKHYAFFPLEWIPDNIRQLNETSDGGFDYIVTSALRHRHADFELVVRIWEVKKFRELKMFTTRWTPSTAAEVLTKMHQQLRTYMEWAALPEGQGLPYVAPAAPDEYIQGLAVCLTHFLGEKGVLLPELVPAGTAVLQASAQANPDDMRAQLALVSALVRLTALKGEIEAAAMERARAWLAGERAQAAGISGLALQLK